MIVLNFFGIKFKTRYCSIWRVRTKLLDKRCDGKEKRKEKNIKWTMSCCKKTGRLWKCKKSKSSTYYRWKVGWRRFEWIIHDGIETFLSERAKRQFLLSNSLTYWAFDGHAWLEYTMQSDREYMLYCFVYTFSEASLICLSLACQFSFKLSKLH